MVFPLADKPSTIPLDAWFTNVQSSANQNPETARLSFVLNGLPALKVRYINKNDRGGVEMEAVYVVSGSRTFSINFSGDNAGRLETLSNFPAYMKMVESFKVEGSVGSQTVLHKRRLRQLRLNGAMEAPRVSLPSCYILSTDVDKM